jgi:hypothetical protein
MRILGVHGIGNYRYFSGNGRSSRDAAAIVGKEWSSWLLPGLTPLGCDVRIAYYAHHLHRGTVQGIEDPAMLEPAAQDLLVAWVELLQQEARIAQGPRTMRARQAADWLTRHLGPAARLFALLFCREVHTYLSKPDSARRRRARDAVAAAINEHGPSVVLAHSLGSVVAYEALWAHPALRLDLLVTLGSPLAMPGVVYDRLQPDPVIIGGARPPGVRRWINMADVGDIVAVPRGGLSSSFDGIELDVEVAIDDWDFHRVRNYLACDELRAVLADFGVDRGTVD